MVINPVATSDTVWVLPTQTTGEYFLFENRAAIESDSAQMNPAYVRAKAPGLYVWHIDQTRIQQGTWSNTVNAGAVHGVALVQADGLNQLAMPGGGNRGDRGDAFPGTGAITALDACTVPGLRTNAGKLVSGRVDSIRIGNGQEVLFRFRQDNLLLVSQVGVGSVTSSIPGAAQGCFGVTPGTTVTLTASPSAGHRFVGWAGDTTATDSVLVLPMARSYSVAALFTAPSTTALLASDLLGVPSLSAAQRVILDDNGNKNGAYDLGDFLRWVTVYGEAVPPELLARLLAAAGPGTGQASQGVIP